MPPPNPLAAGRSLLPDHTQPRQSHPLMSLLQCSTPREPHAAVRCRHAARESSLHLSPRRLRLPRRHRAENPLPGKSLNWNWIFKAVPENHWQWSNRTGVALGQTNGDYWKLLVPGVGRAPS